MTKSKASKTVAELNVASANIVETFQLLASQFEVLDRSAILATCDAVAGSHAEAIELADTYVDNQYTSFQSTMREVVGQFENKSDFARNGYADKKAIVTGLLQKLGEDRASDEVIDGDTKLDAATQVAATRKLQWAVHKARFISAKMAYEKAFGTEYVTPEWRSRTQGTPRSKAFKSRAASLINDAVTPQKMELRKKAAS